MLFTDVSFLFRFLPLVLGLYFLVAASGVRSGRRGTRPSFALPNVVLLGAGLAFVARGTGTTFVGLAALVIALNHGVGRGMERARRSAGGGSRVPELLLTVGVWGNLIVLASGKLLWSADSADRTFAVPHLLAPIGLSVFALHAMSFLVDVYRGEAATHRNPVHTALYLALFPLLIAGPIVRYRDMAAALSHRQIGMAAFAFGVRRFVVGLGKVWLVARTLGAPADLAFSTPSAELSLFQAWFGAVCFALQIYFDLSGYADMAVGLGRILGFRLAENYRWPYAVTTLQELWRRWNLSLIAWFHAYVGVSWQGDVDRPSRLRWRPIVLLLLVALWHGPTWGIVAWGAYHGVLVVVEQAGLAGVVKRLPWPLPHLYLLVVVMAGWVFFRAETLPDAARYLAAMAGLTPVTTGLPEGTVTPSVLAALVVGAIGVAPLAPTLSRWSVTLDAMTTSILMLASTTVVFTWRSVSRPAGRILRLIRSIGH